jgi:hypothetical protein
MPLVPGRRAGIVVLLALLALVPLLAIVPSAPGAVRIAGVSLLWWYAGLVAPLLSTLLTMILLAAAAD